MKISAHIKNKVQEGDDKALRLYLGREGLLPARSFLRFRREGDPSTDDEVIALLRSHIAERATFTEIEAWHAYLANFDKDNGDVTRLVRVIETMTGVSDALAFPVIETEETRRRDRQVEALRQRRPEPVPVDPTLQGRMDLPLPPEAMTSIVKAHVAAWLFEIVDEPLPSPVKRYVRARQWGEGRVAARVHLFDGSPATIYVKGAPKRGVMPDIRHRGGGFFFHRSEWIWMRAEPGQTHSDMCDKHGDDFV